MLNIQTLRGIVLLMAVLSLAALPMTVGALKDPSAAYCEELGYQFVIETTEAGDMGYCVLPGNQRVDAWEFLEGMVGEEYSFCEQEGYILKTVEDKETCLRFLSDRCAVCVLDDGSEVEVTELMELDLRETTCGDKICGFPENFKTCPSDCLSGSMDGYCDGIADGTCDVDCGVGQDPDCVAATGATPAPSETEAPLLGTTAVLALAGALCLIGRMKR